MNIAKKIFCRIYQFAFHIALPVLPYREPKILKDNTEIASEIKKLGLNSTFIITDEFLKKSGLTETLEKSLKENNIRFVVYDKTRPNPTVQNVDETYKLYTKEKCETIIAFGGGSAMDCAKAMGARVAYKGRSLDKLKGDLKIYRKLPPLFAIPTTAGTGSEVTVTAVITDPDKKHKYTMNSFPLIPRYAVLDPKNTYTLPKNLTATTGMDALTHAVEAYIGNSTSKETRMLSEQVAKLVVENIETAYNEPENYEARANAHSLGGQYNAPHGLANSVLLPIC